MGPADGDTARGSGGLEPPAFSLQKKLEYREKMEAWIELVAQKATVDKTFKGICSSLALIVIGSLPKSQQEVVNASVSRGEIVKKHPSFQMQLRAVQQIIALVAEDSPSEVVARVADAFRRVSKCVRSKGETLKMFAVRFQGLAQTYLRVSGATQQDAAGMVLALSFLENANLQPETRNQVQLQLGQGPELDSIPITERMFLCHNHVREDEYEARRTAGELGDSSEDGENYILAPHVMQARDGLRLRKRNDSVYHVPDNLFVTKDSPVPVFTIDQIFLVFSRMPDLPASHDDHVTTKQLKSFMESVKNAQPAASSGVTTSVQQPSSKSKRSQPDGLSRPGRECGRCFSHHHLWDSCPMRSSTCTTCGKMGHESWICFTSAEIDVRDRTARLQWARSQAAKQGLRNDSSSVPMGGEANKRARTEGTGTGSGTATGSGSGLAQEKENPSALFHKRRQG